MEKGDQEEEKEPANQHSGIRNLIFDPFKGSPEGSSDQEFRGSILCDVIEIS